MCQSLCFPDSVWQMLAAATLFFTTLYWVGALITLALIAVCKRIGWGRVLDTRPLPATQIRQEIQRSTVSILLFGVGSFVPWFLVQQGYANLSDNPPIWKIILEIIILFFWNEIHFYACHRLLHTRPLRRFHTDHHRSVIPTPFATYSFHPVEALLLGSVPLLPMMVWDFSLFALLSLPVFSIVLNNLGHSNYEFSHQLTASRRHHLHHAYYHGNYGFLLSFCDKWAGTAIDENHVPKRRQPEK